MNDTEQTRAASIQQAGRKRKNIVNKLSDDRLLSPVLYADGVQRNKAGHRHNAVQHELLVEGNHPGGAVPGHLSSALDRERRTQLCDER